MKAYPHKPKVLLVILVFGVFCTQLAWAGLDLPETDCDSAQGANNIVLGSPAEDGATAFTYGPDNQSFASKTDLVVTLNFNLLFTATDDTTIKVYFMNSNCFVVAGLAFQQFFPEANIFTYDQNTDQLSINGGGPVPIFPNGLPRYLWIEVLDIHPEPTLTSYSYLVDMNNIENPVVTEDPPGEETPPEEEPEPAGPRPVLIIPGIMGSELYEGDELIWPDVNRLLLNPHDGFLREALVLDENGSSVKNIEVGDIINKISDPILDKTLSDTFKSLISILEQQEYQINQNLFFFPYDWRLDINLTQDLLDEKIESIKTQTSFHKVDVVAHSMGGLVAQSYIKSSGTESINNLIFVATPHLGAPKAASVLMTGDLGMGFGPINFVGAESIKDISLNSPSIYQLLPNPKYFEVYQGYIDLVPDGGVMDYSQSLDILAQTGKNQSLLDRADIFFSQGLYDLDYGDIQVSNIVGCNRASTRDFFIINQANARFIGHKTSNGDGTVPFVSADYSSGTKYYVKKGKHSELPSTNGVRQLIGGILSGSENLSGNISTTAGFCPLNGKELNWRSPVEVQIYDEENNIVDVDYEIIDGETYIFLPTDEGQVYTIEGTGIADSSFDLIISDIENDEITNNTLFDNVHIIPGSSVSFIVSASSSDTEIGLDDGIISASSQFEDLEEALVLATSTPPDGPLPPPVSSGGGGGGPIIDSQPEQNDAKILGEAVEKLPDGSLILDTKDNQTVYIIGNSGKKYAFTNQEAFLGLGFNFDMVSPANASIYELTGYISYPAEIHPNGSLVWDGQTIWLINFEKRHPFATMDEFTQAGFEIKNVIKINQADYMLEEINVYE